jgi:hypothetical protein
MSNTTNIHPKAPTAKELAQAMKVAAKAAKECPVQWGRPPKEVPFLMSTMMVQAILAGRKTQTRRTATNIPEDAVKVWHDPKDGWVCQNEEGECLYDAKVKPKCSVGDVLWVRETWAPLREPDLPVRFKADHLNPSSVRWYPSIHLHKRNAGIWLRCTGVRAERLHDISEQDAIAEGIEFRDIRPTELNGRVFSRTYKDYMEKNLRTPLPLLSFMTLWQSLNNKPPKDGEVDGRWDANPWVWVYEFEVLSTSGREAAYVKLMGEVGARASEAAAALRNAMENFGDMAKLTAIPKELFGSPEQSAIANRKSLIDNR